MKLNLDELEPAEVLLFGLKTLAVSLVVGSTAHYLSTRLSGGKQMHPLVHQDPEQTPIENASAFDEYKGKHTYSLQPKANYTIRGLVVETHDSASWLDISYAEGGDPFQIQDLCVVWGDNAVSSQLEKWKFSHGDWTCYVQAPDFESWKAFRKDQLSNNHVLPANDEVLRVIRSAQIGDQIEISGKLVDYSMDGGFSRKTSLVRTDTENGACEIIYAESAKFLGRPFILWRVIQKLSLLTGLAGGLLMIAGVAILPYIRKRKNDDAESA